MQIRSLKPVRGVLVRIHTHLRNEPSAEDIRTSISADECRLTVSHSVNDPVPHVDDLLRMWAEHYVRCHKVGVTGLEYRMLPEEGSDLLMAVRFDGDPSD